MIPHQTAAPQFSQFAREKEHQSVVVARSSHASHQSLALDHLQQPPKGVGAAVVDRVVSGSREAPGFDSSLSAAAALRVRRSASIGSPIGIFTNWLRIDRTTLRLTNLDMKFAGIS